MAALILGAVIVFGGLMTSRNDLVSEHEAVKSSWSQVDVVLQRRADLIPNLVETVKGFATHEEKAIGEVTSARAAMMGARTPQDKIQA
ncbi:MAG: LemA family protein, partial [Bryobacteraceae bacterium]